MGNLLIGLVIFEKTTLKAIEQTLILDANDNCQWKFETWNFEVKVKDKIIPNVDNQQNCSKLCELEAEMQCAAAYFRPTSKQCYLSVEGSQTVKDGRPQSSDKWQQADRPICAGK